MASTPPVFVIGTIKMLAEMGLTEKIVDVCNEWLDEFLSSPTPHALDGAGTSPEYGATSNCVDCGKRIVFCGDGVWLHCEPQNHGHARPNGAIVNPPRQ